MTELRHVAIRNPNSRRFPLAGPFFAVALSESTHIGGVFPPAREGTLASSSFRILERDPSSSKLIFPTARVLSEPAIISIFTTLIF